MSDRKATSTAQPLIGESAAWQDVVKSVDRLAKADSRVTLVGETGVGKNMLVERYRTLSPRQAKPYRNCNVAARQEELVASELFGHTKNAFPGAFADTTGYFAEVDGGILLLDEIGDASATLQARLKGPLDDRALVTPLGPGAKELEVDVVVLAATSRDLDAMVLDGTFLKDLRGRLGKIVRVPPLRDRLEDLLPLAKHYVGQRFLGPDMGEVRAFELSDEFLEQLHGRPWTENARELKKWIFDDVEFREQVDGSCLLVPRELVHLDPPGGFAEHGDSAKKRPPEDSLKDLLIEDLRRQRNPLDGLQRNTGGGDIEFSRLTSILIKALELAIEEFDLARSAPSAKTYLDQLNIGGKASSKAALTHALIDAVNRGFERAGARRVSQRDSSSEPDSLYL